AHADRDALRRHALEVELRLVDVEREPPDLLEARDDEDALADDDLEAEAGSVPLGPVMRPETGDDERLVRLGDLVDEHGADAPSSDGASGEPADDDGARRVLLEHDDARALLDPLFLVGGVGVVGLVAPSDGDHDLAHPAGLDCADDAPDLADEL